MIAIKFFNCLARTLFNLAFCLALGSRAAVGQTLAPPTARDIWQIAQRELESLNRFRSAPRSLLIDAYAQYLDSKGEVLNDSWNIGRISWGPNGLSVTPLELPSSGAASTPSSEGAQKPGFFHRHKPKPGPLSSEPSLRLEGAAHMIFPDTAGIGTDRYAFQYLGAETLGSLRTWTFMLRPKESAGSGAFSGKIWVLDHDIVRFTGTFADSRGQKGTYASFDSVRFKAENGYWVPWRTYLDQTGLAPAPSGIALRANIETWGFDSQAAGLSGIVGVRLDENVDATSALAAQLSSEDVYLEAEGNLIKWLAGVGFLAPAGKFEREVCDPIIQDIISANHLSFDRPLSCRTLLTAPAETVLFESVIGISRSVFDLSPNTATVAVLLAREIALAKVRKNHLDLVWGRPDILMVRTERELINLLSLAPSQMERDQADDLALEYLAHLKTYKRQDLETSAIFFYSASEACKTRPALLAPRFGDGLPGCGRDAHISRMSMAAPPGSNSNPALYIRARTEMNPWDDSVRLIAAQQEDAPFRIIPKPMIPEIAPDDPDPEDQWLVRPSALPHQVPPPTLTVPRKK